MVFPVVMYGCESWTMKKAECRRIDAFELWCWRRLLRVPWTARRFLAGQIRIKETITLRKLMSTPWLHKLGALAKSYSRQVIQKSWSVQELQKTVEWFIDCPLVLTTPPTPAPPPPHTHTISLSNLKSSLGAHCPKLLFLRRWKEWSDLEEELLGT